MIEQNGKRINNMIVNVIIEKAPNGTYDANLEYSEFLTFGLLGQGATVKECIDDFYRTRDDMRDLYNEEGKPFPEDLEFNFKYDIPSFLQYYSGFLTLAGLSRITGVNQGQLSHYLTGHRRPSERTARKIQDALHAFGKEISQVSFV